MTFAKYTLHCRSLCVALTQHCQIVSCEHTLHKPWIHQLTLNQPSSPPTAQQTLVLYSGKPAKMLQTSVFMCWQTVAHCVTAECKPYKLNPSLRAMCVPSLVSAGAPVQYRTCESWANQRAQTSTARCNHCMTQGTELHNFALRYMHHTSEVICLSV